MQPTTPRKKRSPLVRYAPFIAIVVVIAIVAIVLAVNGGNDKKTSVTPGSTATPASAVPIQYQAAKKAGTLDKYTWQEHCDPTTGRVAMPVLYPAPCVPKFTGDNGGVIAAPAVTADTIRIGYYIAKPDPQQDALLQAAGAYDPPANIEQTYKDYMQMFASLYQTLRPQDRAGEDPGQRAADRRSRGEGRRRQGREAAPRVRRHRRTRAGAELLDRARREPRVVHRDVLDRRAAAVHAGALAVHLGRSARPPNRRARCSSRSSSSSSRASPRSTRVTRRSTRRPARSRSLSYDTNDGRFKASWDDMVTELKARASRSSCTRTTSSTSPSSTRPRTTLRWR